MNNTNALIGNSGFVGTTLLKQISFEYLYRSTNISDISSNIFDTVVCAAVPAQKWIANSNPEADFLNIQNLISNLSNIKCRTFVLISTVDVYKNPINVNESSEVDQSGLHPYGLNRHLLEVFVQENFSNHLIVRLPALIGPGLRKNAIFDILNNNNLHLIDSRAVFQFYPMVNLWYDIKLALSNNLKLIHFSATPISVSDLIFYGFGREFENILDKSVPIYDMHTMHSNIYGVEGQYLYSFKDTIQAIRSYAQSEPKTFNNI